MTGNKRSEKNMHNTNKYISSLHIISDTPYIRTPTYGLKFKIYKTIQTILPTCIQNFMQSSIH